MRIISLNILNCSSSLGLLLEVRFQRLSVIVKVFCQKMRVARPITIWGRRFQSQTLGIRCFGLMGSKAGGINFE